VQTFDVPTSTPTRTASLSTVVVRTSRYTKWRRMSATLLKILKPKLISATR